MSELTETEYSSLKERLTNIKDKSLKVSGDLEEASSILIGVEDRGGTWATPIHVDMGSQKEPVDLIEQKARLEWEPAVEEHKSAPTPLTASEKSSALRSVGYMETNVSYLLKQTSRNPLISSGASAMQTSLEKLKAEIKADPPLRRSKHALMNKPHSTSRHSNLQRHGRSRHLK